MTINSKRRSQLVIPFGVGAIVDFKDETWMSAGLNFWPSETSPRDREEIINATQIIDRRLQERISVLLKRTDSPVKFFLQPTIKSGLFNASPAEKYGMPFVRFPRWHFCALCKKMHRLSLRTRLLKKCDRPTVSGKKCNGMLTPIRFLIACEHGHISDFPWIEWVHNGQMPQNPAKCELYFTTNARPGLDGIIIKCKTCSSKRSMAGAMGNSESLRDILPNGSCPGEKPWLNGEEDNDNCLEVPTTVQRGASNTYFANSISSILVPPYSKRVRQILDTPLISRQIKKIFADEKISEFNGISQYNDGNVRRSLLIIKAVTSKLQPIPDDILFETSKLKIQEELDEVNLSSTSEIDFRKKEFDAFLGSRPDELDRIDFDILKQNLSDYEDWVKTFFDSIVLVTSLRETRVLTGFSRIVPTSAGAERVNIFKSDSQPDWLPAMEIRGEGIFLRFNRKTIAEWYKKNAFELKKRVSSRQKWLNDVLENGRPNFTRSDFINSELILVHTFSHILMRQLIFNSGYDSSSLRERLYVSDDTNSDMFGLLIYTASGDSEGTLGGLVSQGRSGNFENVLREALSANICSNDPICIETPKQGIQGLNGAACHSCCLLPETSCEHSNTLLDRTFLFGSEDGTIQGYFAEADN